MRKKMPADPQPFVVKRSRIQGRGCFATRDIRKGERIAEYVGERISWKEADRRYDDDGMRRHHTFLFAVTSRTVIDGAVDGNDSRFINHACDPNCEAIDEKGHIYIDAVRPIAAGEELFYDYAYARDKSTTEEDEALYQCRCGSPECRGTILEAAKKQKRLPTTHHVAARHPHEAGAAQERSRPTVKKGTQKRGKKGAKKIAKRSAKKSAKKVAKKSAKKGATKGAKKGSRDAAKTGGKRDTTRTKRVR